MGLQLNGHNISWTMITSAVIAIFWLSGLSFQANATKDSLEAHAGRDSHEAQAVETAKLKQDVENVEKDIEEIKSGVDSIKETQVTIRETQAAILISLQGISKKLDE